MPHDMNQLTPSQLLGGYANGIFPMAAAADDPRLMWFDPPRRGVLPVGGLHAARSLVRDLRRGGGLGRPRYVATAVWRGGKIVREAKAVVPSAVTTPVASAAMSSPVSSFTLRRLNVSR